MSFTSKGDAKALTTTTEKTEFQCLFDTKLLNLVVTCSNILHLTRGGIFCEKALVWLFNFHTSYTHYLPYPSWDIQYKNFIFF